MILTYIMSAVVGAIVFFLSSKMSLTMRLMLSIGSFLVLVLVATIILVRVGDRASPGAISIDPKQLQEGNKDDKKH